VRDGGEDDASNGASNAGIDDARRKSFHDGGTFDCRMTGRLAAEFEKEYGLDRRMDPTAHMRFEVAITFT
jgi:hypothetical protein